MSRIRNPHIRRFATIFITLCALYLLYKAVFFALDLRDPRNRAFMRWWRGNTEERAAMVTVANREACAGAPFLLSADGYVGLFYGDPRGPYSNRRRHQGIDIFSQAEPGTTPVYAAYDGYITREQEWVSTLIQRVPDDPLNPGQQIWLYYTHMAPASGETDFIEPAFPKGTHELFVEQGTLLGYTGNYGGGNGRRVGTHLHFSIVRDDGRGNYLNELAFDNTLDPSPYLNMAVNYACAETPTTCTPTPLCDAPVAP